MTRNRPAGATIRDGVATVALLGNPNTGKSTLFQALTGVHQKTGNYPGVTVEKKVGHYDLEGRRFEVLDLPGTYSLAPRSPDEMVAVDVLLGRLRGERSPDVIVCIVDGSNLHRNLFLVSQALELGKPLVLAVNMVDLARNRGLRLNLERLAKVLHRPVVPIQAHKRIGLGELRAAIRSAADSSPPPVESPFPHDFNAGVAEVADWLRERGVTWDRFLAERLLLDSSGYLESSPELSKLPDLPAFLADVRDRLSARGFAIPAAEAIHRYRWVGEQLLGVVEQEKEPGPRARWGETIDRVVTHRVWGFGIFFFLMLVVFQSVFRWAEPGMAILESLVGYVGDAVRGGLPDGPLASLLVDGVIAGFGGVVVFLPQILVLFLLLAILEDCGYLARAAYLMDRPMSRIGLSGKSFIPLLSSFACAIPGIMATRVIESRRDRMVTILIAPFMSCSARLPVYTLLIQTFVPDRTWLYGWVQLQGLTMLAAYLTGIVAAVLAAWVFKRTLFRGDRAFFVMEMPSYKWPSPRVVLARVIDRGWAFVRRAGTLIVAVSVLVWAAGYFPRDPQIESRLRAEAVDQGVSEAELENRIAGEYLRQSFLGRVGHFIEPVVRPLGWDWRIGSAVVASFPAREVVLGAMGVIYNLGADQDETSGSLRQTLREVRWEGGDRPVFTLPVALSLIVFFALCAQCAATLVIIAKETNSYAWPVFTFAYMTLAAYVGAWLTYVLSSQLLG